MSVAALITTRPWDRFRSPKLDYEPMPELPPLRRIAGVGAGTSAPGQDILVGLAVPGAPAQENRPVIGVSDICRLLHLPWAANDPVPITYFTDIRCPICRTLERDLASLLDEDPTLFRLHTREFPVFGAGSEAAARLIRAAAGQGASEAMRRYLQTRPAPETDETVAGLGASLGLDPDALVQAWQSDEVSESLAEDRALAERLGLRGTPGLVIGRTVIPGALPRATLSTLIGLEHDAPPVGCAS